MNLTILASDCHVAKSTVVKAAKKMGYSGFVELYYQMKKDSENKNSKTGNIHDYLVCGNLNEYLDTISMIIYESRKKKNIIASFKARQEIADYISRKLMMFDLFAPASYDYDMVFAPTMEIGFIFLIDIDLEEPETLREVFKIKSDLNFKVIIISNKVNKVFEKEVDVYVKLQESTYRTANFTEAKALVFCELLLERYSQKYFKEEYK